MSSSFVPIFQIILKLLEIFYKFFGIQKKYFRSSGRSTSFITSFKSILKLAEFFTSCWQSEKMFRTLRNVLKLCTKTLELPDFPKFFFKLYKVLEASK